mgnify:CR=1 FL=1
MVIAFKFHLSMPYTTSSIFLITNVFNKHSHEFSINFS